MSDAATIDRVAAAMWNAKWFGAPFAATWDQAGERQQRDYRVMATAAIECILSGEAEGGELAQHGGTCSASERGGRAATQFPGASVCDLKSQQAPAGQDAGRQPTPYTPTAPPAEPDPRTPDDWAGGDEPPARDADGLTEWERAEVLAPDDGRNIRPVYDPEHPDDLGF